MERLVAFCAKYGIEMVIVYHGSRPDQKKAILFEFKSSDSKLQYTTWILLDELKQANINIHDNIINNLTEVFNLCK